MISCRIRRLACWDAEYNAFFSIKIIRLVFVSVNSRKFTVHDQGHYSICILGEHLFYFTSGTWMHVFWRITLPTAPFSAFKLKPLTVMHGTAIKEEGIVINDISIVSQFYTWVGVLFFVDKECKFPTHCFGPDPPPHFAKEQFIPLKTHQVADFHVTNCEFGIHNLKPFSTNTTHQTKGFGTNVNAVLLHIPHQVFVCVEKGICRGALHL